MSKIGVSLSIDVTKIDKELLYKGKKGTYLDATVFINIDEKDQYDNNGMITQKVGKDEKGNILGNCKVFWTDGGRASTTEAQAAPDYRGHRGSNQANPTYGPDPFEEDADLPF